MHMKLLCFALAVLTSAVVGTPTPDADATLLTESEMVQWLKTTDAELTFIGEPIPGVNAPEEPDLARRAPLNTIVTYCNTRVNNVCGGACTVYNGLAKCLYAPGTNCLHATHNVGFCSGSGCGGGCNQLSTCGTRLDAGYCWTPGTNSIVVGNY
ncbi:hypothetical protein HDZ31DRAFT_80496 [Schizophyllum fasciatum]